MTRTSENIKPATKSKRFSKFDIIQANDQNDFGSPQGTYIPHLLTKFYKGTTLGEVAATLAEIFLQCIPS